MYVQLGHCILIINLNVDNNDIEQYLKFPNSANGLYTCNITQ